MSLQYQKECLTSPIIPCAGYSAIFSAVDAGLGNRVTPGTLGVYFGGLYAYNAMQCPMEAIHGRPSLIHNILSGGILGYIGSATGRLGVPFVDQQLFWRYPNLSPHMMSFAIYGAITGVLASFGGKRF